MIEMSRCLIVWSAFLRASQTVLRWAFKSLAVDMGYGITARKLEVLGAISAGLVGGPMFSQAYPTG